MWEMILSVSIWNISWWYPQIRTNKPYYKIGEIYRFKIEGFEEVTDIENDLVIIAEVQDINQKKCGVKLPDSNYSRGQIINCKVIGYRKGRPQLEIVL
jgi:hypothetical protein